jgi:hypothetical protein
MRPHKGARGRAGRLGSSLFEIMSAQLSFFAATAAKHCRGDRSRKNKKSSSFRYRRVYPIRVRERLSIVFIAFGNAVRIPAEIENG